MSRGDKKSCANMSCLYPPNWCSPDVEKDGNIWFLVKVLFLNYLFSPSPSICWYPSRSFSPGVTKLFIGHMHWCSQLAASSSAATLRKHLLVHSGEKPFLCKECDYSCTTAGDLKKHMQTHTGERSFSCKSHAHVYSFTIEIRKIHRII